jgi:hypothetical protein
MKIRNTYINKTGGFLIASTTRAWMGTLEYQGAHYDETIDPVHPDCHGPAIYLFWHEYIPVPFYLRGHCNIALLLSQHQDAEWLSQAARHMGFDTIRGSSNRGGVAALRESLRKSRSMNLAITPDGPRGPRRKLAAGPVYLSSRLGVPLVTIGIGYQHCWRAPAWDRFAIPKPYTRTRITTSPRVQIPAGLDRSGIEHHRQRVENLLNRLTEEAEQWAATGTRCDHQIPTHPAPIPIHHRRAA